MPGSWIVYDNKRVETEGQTLEVQVNGRNENLGHTIKVVVWGPNDDYLFEVVTRAPTIVDSATGRSRSASGQIALQDRLQRAEAEATRRVRTGEWSRREVYELVEEARPVGRA
jgi:hypothetical protein